MVFQTTLFTPTCRFTKHYLWLATAQNPKDVIDQKVRKLPKFWISASAGPQTQSFPVVSVSGQFWRHGDPAVFPFDEPLSNLDAGLPWVEITVAQAAGTTFVYVTHDQIEP